MGFAVLTVAFLLVYWLAARDAAVHVGGDTTAFEAVARDQLSWSNHFWTQRPPIYPLLFRLAGFSHPAVAFAQFAVYAAAWVFLSASLWRRNLLVAAAAFYAALFPGLAGWNHVLMTESLATSLGVIAFAFMVRLLDGERWAVWAFIVVMVLKCFLRGFDSILGLFDLPVLAVAAAMRRISWRSLVCASIAFMLCFFAVNRTTGGPPDAVWYFALVNDIGTRVLPDPEWLRYFVAHGMPVNDALLSMTGRFAHEQDMRFFADPSLADFRAWVGAYGRSAYTGYLFSHPMLIFSRLWQHRAEVFLPNGFPPGLYYFDSGYRVSVPPWPAFGFVYAGGTVGAVLLAALLSWRRVPERLILSGWACVLLWLTLLPMALCIYHADAGEIPRHAIPLLLQAALCLLLMGQIAARWRGETRGPAQGRASAGPSLSRR